MIFLLIILVLSVQSILLQIGYFQKYKKQVVIITKTITLLLFLGMILMGVLNTDSRTAWKDFKEDFPIYIIILVIAIIVQSLFRKSNLNNEKVVQEIESDQKKVRRAFLIICGIFISLIVLTIALIVYYTGYLLEGICSITNC